MRSICFYIGSCCFDGYMMLPSSNSTVRYWKWPIEIVDLPNLNDVNLFHSELLVYQRVNLIRWFKFPIVQWSNPINLDKITIFQWLNPLNPYQIPIF